MIDASLLTQVELLMELTVKLHSSMQDSCNLMQNQIEELKYWVDLMCAQAREGGSDER